VRFLRRVPFPLLHRNLGTFSNDFWEFAGNQRLRQRRRPLAGVEQDELSIRTTAAGRIGSLAYDGSTYSVL
jgi:hypothetical protein